MPRTVVNSPRISSRLLRRLSSQQSGADARLIRADEQESRMAGVTCAHHQFWRKWWSGDLTPATNAKAFVLLATIRPSGSSIRQTRSSGGQQVSAVASGGMAARTSFVTEPMTRNSPKLACNSAFVCRNCVRVVHRGLCVRMSERAECGDGCYGGQRWVR